MMDSVVEVCKDRGIGMIMGYYYPTAKNAVVKEFYAEMGFEKISGEKDGSTVWKFIIPDEDEKKNAVIAVNEIER